MRHIERLAQILLRLDNRENMFPWIRLATLVIGGILTFLTFQYSLKWMGWVAIFISLVAFTIVVILHRRLNREIKRCQLLIQQATTQVSRMNLDWGHIPWQWIHRPTHIIL